MNTATIGDTLQFSGVLVEDIKTEPIKAALMEARASSTNGRVNVDFSGVERANSCGLLAWIKILRTTGIAVTYVNMPVWLVEQFNVVEELLYGDVLVASVRANFYSPDLDRNEVFTLQFEKDIPLLEDYSDFTLTLTTNHGHRLEPDFEIEDYLAFVTNNFPKLSRLKSLLTKAS